MDVNYYTIPPPPTLATFVRCFWVLECNVPAGQYYIHRAMADGCAEMLFHYNGRFDELLKDEKTDVSFLSGIHGQSSRYRRFKIDRSFGIFGAYLYPYAIPALLGIPATECTDTMPDLRALLGQEGSDLEERIMLADDNEVRARILASFLEKKLCKRRENGNYLYTSISTVIQQKGQLNVSGLADQYCLSTRQFERRFKELSGFSPKLYCRIVRFQSVFSALGAGKHRLSSIAQQCGYYDQSHFIQDFKAFSGFSPKKFVTQKSTETTIWTS